MTNDIKTVEQVCKEFKTPKYTCENCDFKICPSINAFSDRVLAAHKREMASKDTEITELHNMIEELTDALHPFREWFGNQKLIDRAKEMVGLKEEGDMT